MNKPFTKQEANQLAQEILDEQFNFEDQSVGIYWMGELDQRKVDDFNEEAECVEIVTWTPTSAVFQMDSELVVIELVINEYDSKWKILS